MAFAAYVEDGEHHLDRIFETAFIFEEGQQGGQLLGREEVFLADVEFADLEAELDVGEGVALGGDAVAKDTTVGVAAAEAFV